MSTSQLNRNCTVFDRLHCKENVIPVGKKIYILRMYQILFCSNVLFYLFFLSLHFEYVKKTNYYRKQLMVQMIFMKYLLLAQRLKLQIGIIHTKKLIDSKYCLIKKMVKNVPSEWELQLYF